MPHVPYSAKVHFPQYRDAVRDAVLKYYKPIDQMASTSYLYFLIIEDPDLLIRFKPYTGAGRENFNALRFIINANLRALGGIPRSKRSIGKWGSYYFQEPIEALKIRK